MASRIAALCIALAALLAACGGGAPDPANTPSPTPATRGSPELDRAAITAHLAEAERLYAEGSFEEAIAAFQRAARSGSPAVRGEATWRLAQVHFERGQSGEARAVLEPYVAGGGLTPERERAALLLLGNLRLATGDLEGGEQALRAYVDTGAPATPYAEARLAQQLASRRDYTGAAELLRDALGYDLPPPIETRLRFDLAGYLEDAGDIAAAAAEYERLAAGAPDEYSRGEALWLLAEVLASSDPARAASALRDLVAGYPAHARALEAIDSPSIALNPPTFRQRALVLFHHRVNGAAAEAFTQLLGDPSADAADAQWRLGILAERFGDYDAALAHYDAAIVALSGTGSTLLGQALWDRALVLELLGRTGEAVTAFTAVADLAPSSEHAPEALFKAGWYAYRAGDAGAASLWERYSAVAAPGHEAAEAHFWLARAHEAAGQPDAGTELERALEAAPLDFYGLRAAARLSGTNGPTPAPRLAPAGEPDFQSIQAWITRFAGEQPPSDGGFVVAEEQVVRGLELKRAGLAEDAAQEFDAALSAAFGDAWRLYRVALLAHEEGLVSLQTRAAWALSRLAQGAPPALFQLVYPIVYEDLVNSAAAEFGVDPYLLLALMRQESLYTPGAGSPAGALGLMQIIPATGDYIAQQLGEDAFTTLDLFRPKVSIRFGAYFLSTQLEGFGGRPEAALAAYNGGPGNAGRWLEAAGPDRDAFVETIDYAETRAYVELVLENWALYRWAYGLSETPSISFAE